MANYKTTVKNDNPVSFHTFDLDKQLLHDSVIIDEIGNKNPMNLFGLNYEIEYISLNPLEPSEQYSILFARNQKLLDVWSPVWGTIQHSVDYALEEWSIEFFLDIDYAGIIRDYGEVGYRQNITTPIINKGSAINIYVQDGYYVSPGDQIYCKILNNSQSVSLLHSANNPVFGKTIHVVATYKTSQIDVNEYQNELTLYVNGQLVGTSKANFFDSLPVMIDSTEWMFGGAGAVSDPVSEYPTQFTAIDQLAIYNYPLTSEQVSYHYKKTKTYSQIVEFDNPTHYWRMNDVTELNNTMVATIGYDGGYYGSYLKNEPAMDNVLDAHSVNFWGGGTAIVSNTNSYGNYNQMMNTNADYSVEFWFNTGQNTKGVLFSCIEELYNYRGVIIYCNTLDSIEHKGLIEVRESEYVITSELGSNYTDNKWHYLVAKRSGSSLILNIDGNEVARNDAVPVKGTGGDPSQVHLMGLAGGDLPVVGNMCECALYARALQDIQINSKYHFSTRHKIFGYTLLEGQGISALVRFYDNITGEKIGEITSKSDGEYTFYTYSNKKLDIVALLPDNVTTRYRIHAPVIPALYDDPHDTI